MTMAIGRRVIHVLLIFNTFTSFVDSFINSEIQDLTGRLNNLFEDFSKTLKRDNRLDDAIISRKQRSLSSYSDNYDQDLYFYDKNSNELPLEESIRLDLISNQDQDLVPHFLHAKKWRSFIVNGKQLLFGISHTELAISKFNSSDNSADIIQVKSTNYHSFIDVALTPVAYESGAKICFVALTNKMRKFWLQLYCQELGGFQLKQILDEQENIVDIVSAENVFLPYFSVMVVGSKPTIRIYSIQISEHKFEIKFICNILVTSPISQQLFSLNGELYLAISTDSDANSVFIYHRKLAEGDFVLIQRLQTKHTKGILFFTINHQPYLAVASSGYQQWLFKWSNGFFEIFQVFKITNAVDWNLLEFSRSKQYILLTITHMGSLRNHAVSTFLWHDGKFVQDTNEECQRGPVFHKVFGADAIGIKDSKTYKDLGSAQSYCIFLGSNCKFVIQDVQSNEYVVSHKDPESFIKGDNIIYFKFSNRGFNCYYDIFHYPKKNGVVSYTMKSDNYLIVTDNQDHSRVFKINIYTFPWFKETDTEKQRDILENIKYKFANLTNIIGHMSNQISNITKNLELQSMNTTLYVNGDLIVGSKLQAGQIKSDQTDVSFEIDILKHKIDKIKQNLNIVYPKLKNAVYLTQNIYLRTTNNFTNLRSSGSVNVEKLDVKTVNKISINPFFSGIYLTTSGEVIKGKFYIHGKAIVKSGEVNLKTINGIPFDKFIATNKELHIPTKIEFKGPITVSHNIVTKGTINGIKFDDLLVLNDSCKILSPVKINGSINLKADFTVKKLNGLDFEDLLKSLIRTDEESYLPGKVVILAPVSIDKQIKANMVNGKNFTKFIDNVLRTDREAFISGHKNFTGKVEIINSLNTSEINGFHLHDLVLKGQKYTFNGLKEFVGTLHVSKLRLDGLINGYNISQDILTTESNQKVSGHVIFKTGFISDSSQDTLIKGLIDDVNITAAYELLKLNEYYHKNLGDTEELHVKSSIKLGSKINSRSWDDIFKDSILKDDLENVSISGVKVFTKELAVRNGLYFNRINGRDVYKDYLSTLNISQVITGTKIFEGEVIIRDMDVEGHFAGFNVEKFANEIVLLDKFQNISGSKVFTGRVHFKKNLHCNGHINGLNFPKDIVQVGGEQVLYSDKNISKVIAHEIHAETSMLINELVYGINITDFMQRRITLTTSQHINVPSRFSKVQIEGELHAENINGFHFQNLLDDLVLEDTVQDIIGHKLFNGKVTCESNVQTQNGVNGFNLMDLFNKTFEFGANNTLPDFTNIAKYLKTDEGINITGKINGYDLKKFLDNVVYQDHNNAILPEEVTADGDLVVRGKLTVKKINGKNFHEIFRIDLKQIITGKYTFDNDLDVHGDIEVKANIYSKDILIDLKDLNSSCWKKNEHSTITGRVNFKDYISISNLFLKGTLNRVNLTELHNDSIYANGSYNIKGLKTFQKSSKFDFLKANIINGVHWSDFTSNIVYLDEPAVIDGVVFKDEVKITDALHSMGDIKVKGTIGGYNFQSVFKNALYIDEDATLTGKISFTKNVYVNGDVSLKGHLNGLKIPDDVVYNGGDQSIDGKKNFAKIIIESNFEVDTTVNNYNLEELFNNTLMKYGNQHLYVDRIINGSLVINGNINVKGDINNLNFTKDLVMLNVEQEILQPLSFVNDVNINGNVHIKGPIYKSIYLEDLAKLALDLENSETIDGTFIFNGHVTFKDSLNMSGSVSVSHFDKFKNSVEKLNTSVEQVFLEKSQLLTKTCFSMENFYGEIKDAAYFFHHFKKIQSFESISAKNQISVQVSDHYHIIEATNSDICTHPLVYTWESNQNKFVSTDKLLPGKTRNWAKFEMQGESYLVSADAGVDCKNNVGSVIYKYNPDDHTFQKYVETGIYAYDVTFLPQLGKDHVDLIFAVVNDNAVIVTFYPASKKLVSLVHFPGGEVSVMESFVINSEHFFTLGYISEDIHSKTIIYQLKPDHTVLKIREEEIPASDIVHFEHRNKHYLIIADKSLQKAINSKEVVKIPVFMYIQNHQVPFTLFQEVLVQSCSDLEVFKYGGREDVYLAAVSANLEVKIFEFAGASGFRVYKTVPAKGAISVSFFYIEDYLYMSVAKDNKKSDLFKAIVQGSRVPRLDFTCG